MMPPNASSTAAATARLVILYGLGGLSDVVSGSIVVQYRLSRNTEGRENVFELFIHVHLTSAIGQLVNPIGTSCRQSSFRGGDRTGEGIDTTPRALG
jgi:hypothetical protein